ncbi:MAG: hypothetical protein OXC42_01030 [Gammaproteobacteria bacterium]|nr:hypothetical protein [Gammaproteobacteria bacterium]
MNYAIKPSKDDFRKHVQDVAPQALDSETITVVDDLWDNWEQIKTALVDGSAVILIDILFLPRNHPELGRYTTWRSLSLILIPVGVLLLLAGILSSYVWGLDIVWKTGLGVLIASYVIRRIGIYICAKDSNKFRDALVEKLSATPEVGMTVLCLEYLCGDIGIQADRESAAFWPELPSAAFV